MKRRYVAMISAVLCSAMILSACGNSKKTESIYTGDKTEVPAWQWSPFLFFRCSEVSFIILQPCAKIKAGGWRRGECRMVFHIAVCSTDAALRSGLERQCMEYFARRQDA